MSPKAKTKAPEKKAKADKKTVERIEHAGLLDVRELTTHFKLGAGDVKAIGSQTFVYDKVSRLVTGNILANGTPKTQSAVFDAFGNITSTTTTDSVLALSNCSMTSSANRQPVGAFGLGKMMPLLGRA